MIQVRQAEHSSKAAEEKAQQLKKSIETAAQQEKTSSSQKTLQFDAITPVKV